MTSFGKEKFLPKKNARLEISGDQIKYGEGAGSDHKGKRE